MSSSKVLLGSVAVATALQASFAFVTSTTSRTASALSVAVDPSTITKKEYEQITAATFDEEAVRKRLEDSYLYPKHVEVIQDLAPIAGEMVDDVVRV